MASNPFFSGRIPQSLFDAVEAYREQTRESKTDVLTRALAQYVVYELEENKPVIPPIQKKLDEIFQRLEALEKNNSRPHNFKQKQKVKQLEITSDNNKITDDNKVNILSTKDAVSLLGCSQSSLSKWKREKKLPKVTNGYQIEDAGIGKWKVTKIDNADN